MYEKTNTKNIRDDIVGAFNPQCIKLEAYVVDQRVLISQKIVCIWETSNNLRSNLYMSSLNGFESTVWNT